MNPPDQHWWAPVTNICQRQTSAAHLIILPFGSVPLMVLPPSPHPASPYQSPAVYCKDWSSQGTWPLKSRGLSWRSQWLHCTSLWVSDVPHLTSPNSGLMVEGSWTGFQNAWCVLNVFATRCAGVHPTNEYIDDVVFYLDHGSGPLSSHRSRRPPASQGFSWSASHSRQPEEMS